MEMFSMKAIKEEVEAIKEEEKTKVEGEKENNRAPFAWLQLNHDRNSNLLRFFDMCEGRLYDFQLPKNLQGGWYCGSSKGWLAIVKPGAFKYFSPKIFLYNPISGIQFQLPPITTILSFKTFLNDTEYTNNVAEFITKVELSSVDATNCVVAATNCTANTLALCKPGDKRWTIVEGILETEDIMEDILFHNGELHVLVLRKGASFATHVIKVGDDDEDDVLIKLIPNNCTSALTPDEIPWNAEDESESIWIAKEAVLKSYLVESDGELLIVRQTNNIIRTFLTYDDDDNADLPDNDESVDENSDEDDDDPWFDYLQANKFEVFKIDHPVSSMVQLTRLKSLGNQVLFVAESSSLSIPATEFNGLKKNCIFFLSTLNYVFNLVSDLDPYVSRESGVFSLEDGRIQRIIPSTKDSIHCRMNWFSPN